MMRSYTTLPGLSCIFLEDSYVLAIEARPSELRISLDLVLTPDHPAYRSARMGEQHSYRRAEMIFSGVTRLLWVDQGAPSARDASGKVDFGNIDSYEWDDAGHRLVGDFGRLEVVAEHPRIELLEIQSP